MIQDFANRGLQELFDSGQSDKIPKGLGARVSKLLEALDAAGEVEDMRSPNADLRRIWKGRFRGCWSVRVAGAWRLVFRFAKGHARGADLVLFPVHKREEVDEM